MDDKHVKEIIEALKKINDSIEELSDIIRNK